MLSRKHAVGRTTGRAREGHSGLANHGCLVGCPTRRAARRKPNPVWQGHELIAEICVGKRLSPSSPNPET